jgi:hypothetical protein
MPGTHTFEGQCHCGAIRAKLVATRPAAQLEVRACQCGFCTRHGSMTISDPTGRAEIEIRRGQLHAYQFASRSATSLMCQTCGVYVGAILQDGDERWSVLSVRGLAMAEFAGRAPAPVSYDAETREQRIARRKAKWTPTELRLID